MEFQSLGDFDDFKKQSQGRQKFIYDGQVIYEWEQTLEDVLIYIKTPEVLLEKNKEIVRKNLKVGQKMPKLEVEFKCDNLKIQISGADPYINEKLTSKVRNSECLWEIDGEEIIITLPKALKGETWKSVFIGHGNLNELQLEEVKKKMLKERFQEEHGGFDFSDANISGNVPDPKNFLGGLKYG